MPSAANAKSEKPASSEATDNSPIRQIMTIIDHKIRNLEKRKSKLTSYRDLQKAGKELKADQKVAVAKYDEVAGTLEFARELSKQVTSIATSAEREAKKQAKKDAWVRYAADTNKIREVLLVLDCLVQMGNSDARNDFLNGTNGAVKLTEEDLKILDDLYPEVTPKHEPNEEGQPGFFANTIKAAEHLYAIIDGKPKEMLGTTYTHIKEIVASVHECGYFDKGFEDASVENEKVAAGAEEETAEIPAQEELEPEVAPMYAPPTGLPVPPEPAVVPAPAYPLRPLPPITLQEVEHAYFAQQYPQQRPISEVIGSQNFFFLQESEIDSPIGTPQPPPILNQPSPPAPIPTQTFTNQHFVQLPGVPGIVPDPSGMPIPPQPHFPPHPEHAAFAPVPLATVMPPAHPSPHAPPHHPRAGPGPANVSVPVPGPSVQPVQPLPEAQPIPQDDRKPNNNLEEDRNNDEWKESQSPEREETGERKTQGQGDGQGRFRRYGRGGRGGSGAGTTNGYRGRGGAFQSRQGGDYHGSRHGGEYQNRPAKDDRYQNRQYNDGYQNRHNKDVYSNRSGNDGYYGNGDAAEGGHQNENGGRDRYNDNNQNYQGGFKGRGRGGPRGGSRGGSGGAPRPPRSQQYNNRNSKPENVK